MVSQALSPRETSAWRAFVATARFVMGEVERTLEREAHLSGPDFAVLTCLVEAKGHQLRQGALLKAMCWDKTRLSHHLTRMEQRKLIRRDRQEVRTTMVELTRLGQKRHSIGLPIHAQAVRHHFFDQVSPVEVRAILRFAKKVRDAAEENAAA